MRSLSLVVVLSMVGLLLYATVGAFTRPAHSTLEVPVQSEVQLPPEDLALLESRPPEADRTSVAHDVAPAVTESQKETESQSGTDPKEPEIIRVTIPPRDVEPSTVDHSRHQKKIDRPPPVRRDPVKVDEPLPQDSSGRTNLHWGVLESTTFDEDFVPTFPENLVAADGQQVSVDGFISPLDEVGQMNTFLFLEMPIGCFYCETPDPTGIVLVELKPGMQSGAVNRPMRVQGTLRLNADDPDDFLYIISNAEVVPQTP